MVHLRMCKRAVFSLLLWCLRKKPSDRCNLPSSSLRKGGVGYVGRTLHNWGGGGNNLLLVQDQFFLANYIWFWVKNCIFAAMI